MDRNTEWNIDWNTEHNMKRNTKRNLDWNTERNMEWNTKWNMDWNTERSGTRSCAITKYGTEQQLSLSMLRSEFHSMLHRI